MKKLFNQLLKIILLIVLIVIAIIALVWGKEISTITSVRSVEGNEYLYEMTYKASYDLDDIINHDIESNSDLLAYVVQKIGKGIPINMKSSQVKDTTETDQTFACTSFQASNKDGEGYFYGRNYDYYKNPTLVTHNKPKNGYSSIAVSDMSHFGYSLEKVPNSIANKILCIASVYAPVDGMNEKGLCTSIMALPKQAAYQDSEKHVVGTTILMRLWLDRCATVDEAIELVNSLDVRHDQSVGSGYHYMVADANGKCAVIEFDIEDGWKTMIVKKDEEKGFMHVTNHLLSEKYYTEVPDQRVGNINSHSWWRYAEVEKYLSERKGSISFEEAQECLSIVHWENLVWENGMVEDTQYSNVYDQSAHTLYLRNWNCFDTTYTFEL